MTIQDWGAIGEIVGGIAVVVTLIYLAAQIRQNTRAVRANTFQGVVDSLTSGIAEITRDAEVTRIWIVGLSQSEELSEFDRGRFRLLILMAVRKWENALYQSRAGMLDNAQWEGILQDIRSIVGRPGFQNWWTETPDIVSSEFREFIEELMEGAAKQCAAHVACID